MIFLEGCTSTRRFLDEYLLGNGVVLQPEFELATSDMIVQFALRNLGVGCVVRDSGSCRMNSLISLSTSHAPRSTSFHTGVSTEALAMRSTIASSNPLS